MKGAYFSGPFMHLPHPWHPLGQCFAPGIIKRYAANINNPKKIANK
jgi:hypothetical protein